MRRLAGQRREVRPVARASPWPSQANSPAAGGPRASRHGSCRARCRPRSCPPAGSATGRSAGSCGRPRPARSPSPRSPPGQAEPGLTRAANEVPSLPRPARARRPARRSRSAVRPARAGRCRVGGSWVGEQGPAQGCYQPRARVHREAEIDVVEQRVRRGMEAAVGHRVEHGHGVAADLGLDAAGGAPGTRRTSWPGAPRPRRRAGSGRRPSARRRP